MNTGSKVERFVQNYSAAVPIGGTSDLFTIIVPVKAKLRLRGFGNYAGTLAAWGTIYWAFLLNGGPFYPYERILDQLGYGAQRQDVQPIEISGGSTLIVRAYNPTAAICDMGISLDYELEYQDY
jgi:hypothetical protein